MHMQIVNVTRGTIIAQRAQIAASSAQRMKGLLGRKGLSLDEALVLKPCSAIHTFFMQFAIDVLFLGKNMRIIKAIQNMPPNRLSPIAWASLMVVELPAGKINQTNTQVGDIIEIKG